MILISHRGNINGPNLERENSPDYIDEALGKGYEVEVDLRVINGEWFLGHDEPRYKLNKDWFHERRFKLWIHCKCFEALETLSYENGDEWEFFWHQEDDYTITSSRYIWAYPGKETGPTTILVLPELTKSNVENCYGICSDYIEKYSENK